MNKKFYFLYEVTNLINDKIYVGIHGTNNMNDGYLGSGVAISRAHKKYGKNNFSIKYLKFFDNENAMKAAEAKIVTKEFVKMDSNYNLIPGGGWLNYGKRIGVSTKFSEAQKLYQSKIPPHIRSARMARMGNKSHWSPERKQQWANNLSKALKGNINCSIASKKVWESYTDEQIIERNRKISKAKIELYSKMSIDDKIKLLSPALEASKARKICEFCGKSANTGNYSRWHGNNCKMRK